MEYRQLPYGNENEKFGVLGLGMGGIQHTPADEIEAIIRKAIDNGINFFDLCAGGAVYEPFGRAIKGQREKVFLQYAIDRPGVLVAVPGVQTMEHLDTLLKFLNASEEEKDYSIIGNFTADTITGTCVYCNHCQPCPAGIDIGLVNKYYDLALAGDELAANHYTKLSVKADACLQCGHCESRCPFGVKQESRMEEIHQYFDKRSIR